MQRVLVGLAPVLITLALVGCGSDIDERSDGAGDRDSPGQSGGGSSEPAGSGELSYLTVTASGLSRIATESGEAREVIGANALGLAPGESPQLVRLVDGLIWASLGPGHLIAIDPESGEIDRDLEFGSAQPVTDYGFAGGLLWVQAGFIFSDAVVLGVDRSSGDLVFNIEPPAGATIGGLAAGDEGVWVIGGNPESASAISRIDAGSGTVTGTFDVGLVVKQISVGAGAIWAGGDQFAFEGKDGDAVARIDSETGEIVATIEIGDTLASIIEYDGAIWVSDASGPSFSGAQLHRIDPVTNEITASIDVGEAGTGSLELIGGDGYIFAINSADRQTYVISTDTMEVESVIVGPTRPFAIN